MKRLLAIPLALLPLCAAAAGLCTPADKSHISVGGKGTPAEGLHAPVDTMITVEHIQITAVKQSAVLRNQPAAISLFNSADIERERITALKEASLTVPNFFIPDYGSRMTSSVYVRGLGARIDQPVVGMNIDNLPVMNKDAYDFDLNDVERIEILRGPQSTLYGRNTMGGVINIYTISPFTFNGIRIGAEYASANSMKFRASVYNKIGERFGTAVAAYYSRSDGFYRNMFDNSLCDGERQGGGRFRLQWRNMRNISLDNTFSFSITRQDGYPYAYAGRSNDGDDVVDDVVSVGEISYDDPCGYDRTTLGNGLTFRYDTPAFSLASVTGYQYLDDKMTLDQDFTPLPYFTLVQDRTEHAVTEEIVMRSKGKGRYSWLCGAFGFYRHTDMNAPVRFRKTGINELIINNIPEYMPRPVFTSDELLFDSRFDMPSYGAAVYHESDVRLGKFDIAAGIRFDFEQAHLRYDCSSDADAQFGQTHIVPFAKKGSLRKSFFEILPKLTVTFRPDARNSVYASASKGYKAGGFNTQMFSEVIQSMLMAEMGVYWTRDFDIDKVVSYKPEYSWNFEIGSHLSSADGRFAADLALFYIDCRDRQLTVFPEGQTTGRMMTNAGKSRSFGGEMSARISPFENFDVYLSYGYTNASFTEFRSGKNDYAGKTVPYAPQHTASARISYGLAINSTWLERITFSAGYKGTGRIYWDEENTLSQPYYSLLDCSVKFSQKHYAVEIWGRNLTGTKYDVFHFESISHRFLQRGKPRMFGITLSIIL